jgi:hypothetical protein
LRDLSPNILNGQFYIGGERWGGGGDGEKG